MIQTQVEKIIDVDEKNGKSDGVFLIYDRSGTSTTQFSQLFSTV